MSEWEVRGLINAFESVLTDDIYKVFIFGSRLDLTDAGGDIDLLIECSQTPPKAATEISRALRLNIYDQIGEQKIDLVWDILGKKDAFIDLISDNKLLLWPKKNKKRASDI